MKNQFAFGQVVTGESFTNRATEKEQLRNNFLNGIHTVIIAPRRYGKTSLVEEVAGTMAAAGEIRYVRVDFTAIADEYAFYQKFIKDVLRSTNSKVEEIAEFVKAAFKAIKPQITMDTGESQASIGLVFSQIDMDKGYEEILNFPEKIAKRKNIRLVVAFDEFQNIVTFKQPDVFQGQLRSVLQHHKHVSYCFFGSKKHMMEDIFQDKSAPFYRFGEMINLKKISDDDFVPFILKKFRRGGKTISPEQIRKLLSLVDNNPQYVQHMAYRIYEDAGKKVRDKEIDQALSMLISQYESFYQRDFEQLTRHQKMFLYGIIESEESIYSQSFVSRYGLGSTANVAILQKAMVNKDILDFSGERPEFLDPVFRAWIARQKP